MFLTSPINSSSPIPLINPQEKIKKTLLRFTFNHLFIFAFFPPLFGLSFAFIIGYLLDYNNLFNYEWHCGVCVKMQLILIF